LRNGLTVMIPARLCHPAFLFAGQWVGRC